jgi:hypothetical protein
MGEDDRNPIQTIIQIQIDQFHVLLIQFFHQSRRLKLK